MVYITPMQGDKAGPPEGLCLPCANEIGIKPVNDILKKMGMDEDQIMNMSEEIDSLLESQLGLTPSEDEDDGKMPTLNLGEIFGMNNTLKLTLTTNKAINLSAFCFFIKIGAISRKRFVLISLGFLGLFAFRSALCVS